MWHFYWSMSLCAKSLSYIWRRKMEFDTSIEYAFQIINQYDFLSFQAKAKLATQFQRVTVNTISTCNKMRPNFFKKKEQKNCFLVNVLRLKVTPT